MEHKELSEKIGPWSIIKQDIIRDYAKAYSVIMNNQTDPSFDYYYIDAFAGAGVGKLADSSKPVKGSPLRALEISPPFKRYYFIDLDSDKTNQLKQFVRNRADVEIRKGDCNLILVEDIFPRIKWQEYKRALCLLDPYNIDLDWQVIQAAGRAKSIDIFINFQIMDANRNVLWRHPAGVNAKHKARLNRIWGDNSWEVEAYEKDLFGYQFKLGGNERICKAFKRRLKEVAGFQYVAEPIAMKTTTNSPIYYLYFASQKPVAKEIVSQIFDKYRQM